MFVTLTLAQLEARRNHIGASDVPALFGKSPFATAWDVWASKVHGIDSNAGDAAMLGDHFEPVLIDLYEQRAGVRAERHLMIVHKDGVLAANLDGCIRDGAVIHRVIECKTHGLASPARRSDEWGEPGTDQVPDDVMLQVQTQLEVADCPVASVELLMGGRGHLSYVVDRNRRLGAAIVKKATAFWRNYVVTRVPPPDSAPRDPSLARRLPIVDGLTLPIPDDIAGRFLALRHMESLVGKAKKKAEGELLAFLNGATRGATAWGDIELKQVAVRGHTTADRVDTRLTTPRKASAEAFEALVGSQQLPALVGGVTEIEDE